MNAKLNHANLNDWVGRFINTDGYDYDHLQDNLKENYNETVIAKIDTGNCVLHFLQSGLVVSSNGYVSDYSKETSELELAYYHKWYNKAFNK